MVSFLKVQLNRLSNRLYSRETNFHLNYLTLQVRNKEIKNAIQEHCVKSVTKMFWPLMILSFLSLIVIIFNLFV